MKTLLQHLDGYLAYARTSNQSPVHLRNVAFCVLRFLRWLETLHSVTMPWQLTPQHLDVWVKHYASESTRKGMPRKPTSVSKQFQCARAYLKWLGKGGILPQPMYEQIPKVKLPHKLPTGVLVHKQMQRLLELVDTSTVQGRQFRAMLEFLYSSGVRAEELLGLNVTSADRSNLTATVTGKGAKDRIVPFGETAKRYLETYLRGIRPLLLRDPSEPALWLNRTGERMPYHTFRRQLVDLSAKARLPVEVTCHVFRRTFTTEMLRAGANPYHLSIILGHASVETLKPYAKLTIVDLKKTHSRCHPRERDRS